MKHHYQDLIYLFNHCFAKAHNTKLVKGDEEPIYLPANASCPYHAIYFAHGFFSSALHECAHWFIAGSERRKQVDYGYWYEPDGRSAEQQALFLSHEVKPQALEWIFSNAAGYKFQISIDNLNGESYSTDAFKACLIQQMGDYQKKGLPRRAEKFRQALCDFYGTAELSHFSSDRNDSADL
ncbi:MAG: elongation factor P hydroxylase [Legionellaceae bacterium]|nr:elongation factor P hydroxylase [Legionellaceae bacterium]